MYIKAITKYKVFLKDQKGSLIVEAALVFPIIIVSLLLLITLTIMLHDAYLFELTTEMALDLDVDNTFEIKTMVNDRTFTPYINYDINCVTHQETKDKSYVLTYALDLPMLHEMTRKSEVEWSGQRSLDKIMYTELFDDTIDSISISQVLKESHKKVLESVLSALKYH